MPVTLDNRIAADIGNELIRLAGENWELRLKLLKLKGDMRALKELLDHKIDEVEDVVKRVLP